MDLGENKKLIIGIIIAVVIIVIIGATAYMMTNQGSNTDKMNVTLNGVQFTVPSSCSTVNDTGDGWSQYMSSSVCIMSFCSSSAGLGEAIKYGTSFNVLRAEFQTGAETVTVGNITLNKTSNGTYSYEYGDNTTHQNILIVGTDKDIVASVVASMIYTGNNISDNNTSNSTEDNNSKTTSDTSTTKDTINSNNNDKSSSDEPYLTNGRQEQVYRGYDNSYHTREYQDGQWIDLGPTE